MRATTFALEPEPPEIDAMAPIRLPAAALLLLALAGCSGHAGAGAGSARGLPVTAPPPGADYDYAGGEEASVEALVVTGESLPSIERQIIREAWAEVEVDDPARQRARVVAMIPPPGYIEATEAAEEHVRLTMRVPADALDAFLARLDDIGDVENLTVTGRDVTEQLTDWNARLQNLLALRDRLRQHLDRAANVQELVMVERELARVQTEIDSLSARLESMRTSVALSRVTVVLTEERKLGPLGYVFYGLGKALGWLFVRD